jgi:GTP-binding protein
MALSIFAERARRIGTPELTQTILEDIHRKPPPSDKGKFVKIKFVTQAAEPPPTFVFFCNRPEAISESYTRFLANRLRERFGFEGVPLRIRFRNKGR